MLKQLALGSTLLLAVLPQAAIAAPPGSGCDLHLVATPSRWVVNDVDVFATEPAQASFDLQLVNDGAEACRVRLGVNLQGAPFGLTTRNGKHVAYALSDATSGNDLTPRSGRSAMNSRRTVVVAPNSETLVRFDAVVAPEFDGDGSYSQQLLVQASDNVTGATVAEKVVTLSAEVASSATIALSGNFTRLGGMADVDLGEITQGDIKVPVIMHIKSTRAYQIRFMSENGGKLMLAGTGWSIPYRLTVDDVSISPANGLYSSPLGNNRRVDNMKLGFAITGGANVAAGRYSDIVTLEIALN